MQSATTPAAAMEIRAPVPAAWITPGRITKTDDAGVSAESVRNSAPITPMPRASGRAPLEGRESDEAGTRRRR